MTIIGRVSIAVLLISLSFSVAAENYMCKQPNGSTTYQDTPCTATGDTQQVVSAASGDVLGLTMSEAATVGLRIGAQKAADSGRMSKVVAACLGGMRKDRFYSTFQHLLAENLSAADLKAANAFFNSSTGRKYSKRNVLQVYSTMGVTPPEQAPLLTATEENEVSEFTSTSAGQTLITRRFLSSAESRPEVVARLQEIYKECGARRW